MMRLTDDGKDGAALLTRAASLTRMGLVRCLKGAALQVFEVLLQKDPKTFVEQAVTIRGRKRPYVTPDPDELRSSAPIPTTDLYFEANLSTNFLVKLCYTLLEKMGFSQSDLQFETAK